MSWTYSYPKYGMQRGGTLQYVNGGGAYSGFTGWGQEGGGQSTTSTGVATTPADYASALMAQAAAETAAGTAALVSGNAAAGAAHMAAAAALYKKAEDVKAGRVLPPGIATAHGQGGGLARIRAQWAALSPGAKVAVGVGGGVGALALLKLVL